MRNKGRRTVFGLIRKAVDEVLSEGELDEHAITDAVRDPQCSGWLKRIEKRYNLRVSKVERPQSDFDAEVRRYEAETTALWQGLRDDLHDLIVDTQYMTCPVCDGEVIRGGTRSRPSCEVFTCSYCQGEGRVTRERGEAYMP